MTFDSEKMELRVKKAARHGQRLGKPSMDVLRMIEALKQQPESDYTRGYIAGMEKSLQTIFHIKYEEDKDS